MENAYAKSASEVVAGFNVDPKQGLTDSQVVTARGVYGRNELAPDEGTPLWKLVLKQFDDLLVKILIVAAVVDLLIALVSGESGAGVFVEPGVIVLILIANATVGVITETKAEKAIESLKAYEADAATVLRHGHLTLLPAAELVPGDIVEVTVGGKVPADLRVIQLLTTSLRVDQSILTGESGSVRKDADVADRRKAVYQDMHNILFSGTVLTAGRARGVVVATGPGTAIGRIRDAMADVEEEMTPLKRKLDEFGTFLSKVIAVICVLVWVINIPHFGDPLHGGWFLGCVYYFKIAVALAVAAIPEGLPAVVTTCLALGTRQMAKHNAIVRTLPSVETLGCTTVICSDKTGTLTTNQMSVAKVAVLSSKSVKSLQYNVTGNTFLPEGVLIDTVTGTMVQNPGAHPALSAMARCAALCNDSTLYYDSVVDAPQHVGESTEVALRVLAEKIGVPGVSDTGLTALTKEQRISLCNDYWTSQLPRLGILEFSRERKMMSSMNGRFDAPVLFTKGAPEMVLSCCINVLTDDGATTLPLTSERQQAIRDTIQQWGSTLALRCLALATRTLPPGTTTPTLKDEQGLTFLGVVGIHDPPRKEVAHALEVCHAAGIRVIVLTGDNLATAEAVCNQIGLPVLPNTRQAITGLEFDELPPVEQEALLDGLRVMGRVEPTHKSKLIELLKKQDNVVAMTGDGVNDAPALKKADIGVAMGSGTAVAKHAADMVLADDNFVSIVKAVEQGRCIYANTKQFIRYMVSSNIGEVVAIFSAALVGLPETLNPVQLLWVNLVTDGLPATALGCNKPDPNIMRTKPRSKNEGIVDQWLFIRYMVIGTYVGVVTVMGFVWWYLWYEDGPKLTWSQLVNFVHCKEGEQPYSCSIFSDKQPSTISMSVLVVVEMFNALNALSENESLLRVPFWSNPWLLSAIALSMLLHFTILYTPWLALLFSVTSLSWPAWRVILLLSFPVIIVDELLKLFSRTVVVPGRLPVLPSLRRVGKVKYEALDRESEDEDV